VDMDEVNLLTASEIEPCRLVRNVGRHGIPRIAESLLQERRGLLHLPGREGEMCEAHRVLLSADTVAIHDPERVELPLSRLDHQHTTPSRPSLGRGPRLEGTA